MVVFPFCKINLGLNITGKRTDGYHNIETCFVSVCSLSDILEIVPSKTFAFAQTGINIESCQQDNLVVKAYQLLQEKYDIPPVKIHLHKCIPTGAGLGGGSADAAQTIVLLNQLFDLQLTKQDMQSLANQLGSDCAFFIEGQSAIGRGRGNELTKIDIPQLAGKYLLLVKPDVHVSTAMAYSGCRPHKSEIALEDILQGSIKNWKDNLVNDFEQTVFPIYPVLNSIKQLMYQNGALYASMSGSGATVYGIFEQIPPKINFGDTCFCHSTKI